MESLIKSLNKTGRHARGQQHHETQMVANIKHKVEQIYSHLTRSGQLQQESPRFDFLRSHPSPSSHNGILTIGQSSISHSAPSFYNSTGWGSYLQFDILLNWELSCSTRWSRRWHGGVWRQTLGSLQEDNDSLQESKQGKAQQKKYITICRNFQFKIVQIPAPFYNISIYLKSK